MARNRFEVESLNFKHFYGNSQKMSDVDVLKKIEQYINAYLGSIIKDSSSCVENTDKLYMFNFKEPLPVEKVVKMLKDMFVNDEWVITRTYHNLPAKTYTIYTL